MNHTSSTKDMLEVTHNTQSSKKVGQKVPHQKKILRPTQDLQRYRMI